MTPDLRVLPPAQRALWNELDAVPDDFVLYGGTALALRLGHRISVDYDFFGWSPFDPAVLQAAIPFLAGGQVLQSEPNTLTVLVEREGPVQVSFFGVPRLGRVEAAEPVVGRSLKVASEIDLVGTKAALVQRRAEAKDYIDIDAVIAAGRLTLPDALAAARVLYGSGFNAQLTLKALCHFDDGSLRDLPDDLRNRLVGAVRAVDLDRLPSIPSLSRASD